MGGKAGPGPTQGRLGLGVRLGARPELEDDRESAAVRVTATVAGPLVGGAAAVAIMALAHLQVAQVILGNIETNIPQYAIEY